jgi:hypothetical protein
MERTDFDLSASVRAFGYGPEAVVSGEDLAERFCRSAAEPAAPESARGDSLLDRE